jgi:anthranilate/para-aminobenzoate synthase component II
MPCHRAAETLELAVNGVLQQTHVQLELLLLVDGDEAATLALARQVAAADARIRAFAPKGIILSGGPASVTEGESPRAPDGVFAMGLPVLGICYGQQTMAAQLGGAVERDVHAVAAQPVGG